MNAESIQMASTRYQSLQPNIDRKESNVQNFISFIHSSPSTSSTRRPEAPIISPTPPPSSRNANKDHYIQISSSSQRNTGRLPPTVDPSLAQQCQITRSAFVKALANDQSSACEPEYRTAFTSANDVVKRLLPYHVWHVRDEDILHILNDRQPRKRSKDEDAQAEGSMKSIITDQKLDKISSNSFSRAKRRKQSYERRVNSIDQVKDQFPTRSEADHAWQRYLDIHSRAKGLMRNLIGARALKAPAPFAPESTYLLEKMAWEEEREALIENQRKLRIIREEAITQGVPWSSILPILTGEREKEGEDESESVDGSDSDANSSSSENGGFGQRAGAQGKQGDDKAMQPKSIRDFVKPRGRPRKERDEYGRIIRPLPSTDQHMNMFTSTTPTKTDHQPDDSNQSIDQSTIAGPSLTESTEEKASEVRQSNNSAETASSYVIPSQPIRLVLPFSTLTQLSALGIHPVPATHLLPAISARQSATSSSSSSPSSFPVPFSSENYDTAPRPSPIDQKEPALLMGFTSTSSIRESQLNDSSEKQNDSSLPQNEDSEMIHISLVLSKLGPSQLSGLATLMQRMQSNGK